MASPCGSWLRGWRLLNWWGGQWLQSTWETRDGRSCWLLRDLLAGGGWGLQGRLRWLSAAVFLVAGLAEVLAAGAGWGGCLTGRRWLRAAGQAEVVVGCSGPGSWAGRGPGCWGRLRRLSAAVVSVVGLAGVLAASWRLWLEGAAYCWHLLKDPGPGPGHDNFLGERQGAAVSSAPGWELTPAAPNSPLYAPGAPCAGPVHASTHAPSWALPANQRGSRQGERQRCRHAWLHMLPNRPARGPGLPECMGALGACQVPVRCCRPALCCRPVPVEVCRWRGHLLAAWLLLCGLSRSFGGSWAEPVLLGPWLLMRLLADLER